MGLETAVANHTTKELFDLGKGGWFKLADKVRTDHLSWMDRFKIEDIATNAQELGELILQRVITEGYWDDSIDLEAYSYKVAKFLFSWLTGCEFCIIHDSDDGFIEFNSERQYKWVGHRYEKDLTYRNWDTDHNILETLTIPGLDDQLLKLAWEKA